MVNRIAPDRDIDTADLLRTLGRFASNPDLSMAWYDAAMLSQKIKSEIEKAKP